MEEKIVPAKPYQEKNKIEKEKKRLETDTRKNRRNKAMILIIFSMVVLSMLNMFSTCLDPSVFHTVTIRNHLIYIGISIIFFSFIREIDYTNYDKNKWNRFLLIGSMTILVMLLIGSKAFPKFVPTINGAVGWVRIGSIGVQPAEFIKLPFVIIIAHLLRQCDKEGITDFKVVFYVLPIMLVFSILIFKQNDLGTMIHYVMILAFMLFFSKIGMKIIVGLSAAAGAVSLVILYYIYALGDVSSQNYKIKRIWVFLTGILKNEYDDKIGYQVGQSLLAFGNGGIFGQGYANGTQKYSYLPEIRTDFIMATWGEEFGFIGMFVVIVFFSLLFTLIKSTAMDCEDNFGKYLAIGIAGLIITQMLINVFVALGMIPVFGVPMPIFSYGGTSLVTVFSALGIIINMNKVNKKATVAQ